MAAILAGNTIAVTSVFTALPGHGSLAGTTAVAAVTSPSGVSTAVSPANVAVTIGTDTVTVVVTYSIADAGDTGAYLVTIDTAGALVAAEEHYVYIRERQVPVMPT
jgi:hypothetical protein